jgi:MoxR-like ATPase
MAIKYEYKYTGKIQPGENDRSRGIMPYMPDGKLVKAVELAINLGRPLLLQGEPGCGKTQLAYHLAYELARRNNLPEGEDWPLEAWPVQSISKAQDGMYKYDAIGRLSNAQLAYLKQEKSKPLKEFIDFGVLGKAIRDMDESGVKQDKRVIVLIDEIDKADIDFPNDLLWVLDKREFQITELGGSEDGWLRSNRDREPIIIITSNREKELPGPFLRRCFYHFINFPEPTELQKILAAHVPELAESLQGKVVEMFWKVRQNMADRTLPGKLISTSELIDWAKALKIFNTEEEIEEKLAAMEKDLLETPHQNTLFKTEDQFKAYQESKT